MAARSDHQEAALTSLRAVDEWTQKTTPSQTDGGSLQILDQPYGNSTATAWCPVVILNSFGESAATEQAAAVAMALHHLNVGDGTRIPQLEGLPDRCPICFSLHTLDTTNIEVIANLTLNGMALPCALVGAGSSSISIVTSIFTGMVGIPQISPTSTSSKLNNRLVHPFFGRTIPDDSENIKVYLDYFRDVLKIRHLTILYNNDEYGSSLKDDLANLNRTDAEPPPTDQDIINPFPIPVDENPFSINQAAAMIRDRQYKYIWSLLPASMADVMMMAVEDADDYQWFFGDVFSPVLYQREFDAESTLESAYRGVGILEATGQGLEEFHNQLLQLDNPSDIEYLESILPPGLNVQSVLQQGSSHIGFSVFAYHAAIAIGLAACEAHQQLYLSGRTHFDQIMNLTLQDLSGETISFLPATGSRNPDTAAYRVRNYVPMTTTNGKVSFRDVTTHEYWNGTWMQLEEFIFHDGTSTIPPDLAPVTVHQEVITTGVRIILLILCGIVISLALGFMFWTERNKKSRVVLASQPFFLHAICLGCFILGCTIIPITIDQGVGSEGVWQAACTAKVWLIPLGAATTFAAFLAKTYRVNRILNNPNKFKRIKVSVSEVALPMIVSLIVDISILTVMTIVAPPKFEIFEFTDDLGRVVYVEGWCILQEAKPYLMSAASFDTITLVWAGWESFKARNLATEFAESRYIFRAMMATLLVIVTGVPLLLLSGGNPNAYAFVMTSILFVASTSILLFTFVPKVQQLKRCNSEASGTNNSKKGRAITKGGSKGPRWRISGLEASPSHIRYHSSSPRANNNGDSTTSFTVPTRYRSSDLKGMKVLTMKTKSELIEENEYLAGTLEEMNHLIGACTNIETLRSALALSCTENTTSREEDDLSSHPVISKISESNK